MLARSTLGAPFSGPGYVLGDAATPGVKTVEVRDIVNVSESAARFIRVQVTHRTQAAQTHALLTDGKSHNGGAR